MVVHLYNRKIPGLTPGMTCNTILYSSFAPIGLSNFPCSRHGKICLNFPRNSPDRSPQVKSRVTEALSLSLTNFPLPSPLTPPLPSPTSITPSPHI